MLKQHLKECTQIYISSNFRNEVITFPFPVKDLKLIINSHHFFPVKAQIQHDNACPYVPHDPHDGNNDVKAVLLHVTEVFDLHVKWNRDKDLIEKISEKNEVETEKGFGKLFLVRLSIYYKRCGSKEFKEFMSFPVVLKKLGCYHFVCGMNEKFLKKIRVFWQSCNLQVIIVNAELHPQVWLQYDFHEIYFVLIGLFTNVGIKIGQIFKNRSTKDWFELRDLSQVTWLGHLYSRIT